MKHYSINFLEVGINEKKRSELFNVVKTVLMQSALGNLNAKKAEKALEDKVRTDMKIRNLLKLSYIEAEEKVFVVVFGILEDGQEVELLFEEETGRHYIELL